MEQHFHLARHSQGRENSPEWQDIAWHMGIVADTPGSVCLPWQGSSQELLGHSGSIPGGVWANHKVDFQLAVLQRLSA